MGAAASPRPGTVRINGCAPAVSFEARQVAEVSSNASRVHGTPPTRAAGGEDAAAKPEPARVMVMPVAVPLAGVRRRQLRRAGGGRRVATWQRVGDGE